MRSCARTSTIYTSLSARSTRGGEGVHEAGVRRQGVPAEDERAGAEARHVEPASPRSPTSSPINAETIDLIKQKHGGDDTKVINLIKSIEKTAEEECDDPFLIAMADRAKQVQENYEDRQASTAEVLEDSSGSSKTMNGGKENRRIKDLTDLPISSTGRCWTPG